MNLDRKAAGAGGRDLTIRSPIHSEEKMARFIYLEFAAAGDQQGGSLRLQLCDQGSDRCGGNSKVCRFGRTARPSRIAALRAGGNSQELSCLQVYAGVSPGLSG